MNSAAQRHVEKIDRMAQRIQSIVKSMRVLSRDGSRDQFKSVTLKKLFSEVLDVCEGRFRNAMVNFRIDEFPQDWAVECQESQISQVIANLLNNSFDAIQELTEKWIQVSITKSDSIFRIEITDSGRGIAVGIQAKLMDPFFTTKEAGKGTGLGLSISRSIVKSHQGNLEYDANSQNTKFILTLPRQQKMFKEAA